MHLQQQRPRPLGRISDWVRSGSVTFDFDFNIKMNRKVIFDLATSAFVHAHEDVLLLGPPGTGKSHLAQALGHAALVQGHRVTYREAHTLVTSRRSPRRRQA